MDCKVRRWNMGREIRTGYIITVFALLIAFACILPNGDVLAASAAPEIKQDDAAVLITDEQSEEGTITSEMPEAVSEEQEKIPENQAVVTDDGRVVFKKVVYEITLKPDPKAGKNGQAVAFGLYKKKLKELYIPDYISIDGEIYDIVGIADRAFTKSELISAYIGNNVSEIGVCAFMNSLLLEKISFGPDIRFTIGDAAFYGCELLSELNWADNMYLYSIGTGAFAFTAVSRVTLPYYCSSVEKAAFYGCQNLTEFCFGINTKFIGVNAFAGCPEIAFSRHKKNSFLLIENGSVYSIDGKTLFVAGSTSGACTLREGITSIPAYFFEGNNSITSLILPDSITEIGECAFKDCTALKSIILPQKLKQIGANAFYNCTSLTKITIPANVEIIDGNPFMFCSKLKGISVEEGSKYFKVYQNMLCSADLKTIISAPSGRKNIKPAAKTRYISPFAFAGNVKIKKLTINSKLKSVGQGAFYGCSSLSYVYIPNRKIDFSVEPWQVDEDDNTLYFCGIFAGCADGMEVNLPFDVNSGSSSSIEYFIQQQCNNSVILTQR